MSARYLGFGEKNGLLGKRYWGQWIQPKSGSDGGSIEGGMMQTDKLGLSYYAKYHAGASQGSYNPRSDTAGGYGFQEQSISCKWQGAPAPQCLVWVWNLVVGPWSDHYS